MTQPGPSYPGGPMSAQDIELLMIKVGFPKTETRIGVGVAMAESGGNPMAHNNKPPDDSYGLFQINMLGALGPSRRKQFGIKDNKALFDPETNTKAALSIWRQSGWNAWTTYTSGKWKAANGQLPDLPTPQETADEIKKKAKELNPITNVVNAVNAFGQTLMKSSLNIGGIAIGGIVLALGTWIVISQSSGYKKTVDVGAKIVKATATKGVVK